MLGEVTDVTMRPLSIIMGRWEVPMDWMKVNVTHVFRKGKEESPGNYRPMGLIVIPRKVMEQILLETISKHVKDKKAIEIISIDLRRVNHA